MMTRYEMKNKVSFQVGRQAEIDNIFRDSEISIIAQVGDSRGVGRVPLRDISF